MSEHDDDGSVTADLCDRRPDARAVRADLRSYGGRRRVGGVAETARVGPSYGLLREIMESAGDGRILVVDAGGPDAAWAVFGDGMAGVGVRNGWAGVVVNGVVRDAEQLALLDLGVWACGTWPVPGPRHGYSLRSVPVTIGGVEIVPGSWVACDPDGIVVCPPDPTSGAAYA